MIDFLIPLAVVFALAFLCESMTEYILGTPFDKFPVLSQFKWALMYVSAGVGVGLAFHYQLDMISMIGQTAPTWVGLALTGLGIGRGANFVHQFVDQYFPSKAAKAQKFGN